MYKVASDKRQSALTRGRLADWAGGEEYQSAETKLRQMQEGVQILDNRIQKMKGQSGVAELGKQKLAMQADITAFRKAMHLVRMAREGYGETFVTMAKQMLPKVTFDLISGATRRELEQRKKALDAPTPEAPSFPEPDR